MDGGGRRQLPSWMMRSTATEGASISETKEENKDGSVKPRTKAIKPQKKVQAKQHDTEVPFTENKENLLKKCETRTRKRKLNKHGEGQDERFPEEEPCLLKPCKESRSKRMSIKHGEDRVDDFLERDTEKQVDGVVSKRARNNVPRIKHSKKFMEEFQNGTAESSPSEDEFTVQDLVSIAEEYVKADREKELQKLKKVEFEPEIRPQLRAHPEIGSEKNLMSYTGNKLVNNQPLSSDSSMTKPLSSEGSSINLSTPRDPCQDMLDLLLGL
ncbi:hypothetical protein SOVF_182150 [Spinacia oleracea]|uniref:Uncharacterized protein LOC110802949 n=1 Tax=Spinacia oleracea TaxID=3562 RepID=A0A9R0K9Z1_SPIOL|nr:uncharacterized protein LOC110802949 [Spinacia oleracea]XP_056693394.1 uncharacterized protein LOC110802949 [Spinacia oleracea]KNA06320.1 hypothetical protein SOVF_182150 [Spinacia oleracea]